MPDWLWFCVALAIVLAGGYVPWRLYRSRFRVRIRDGVATVVSGQVPPRFLDACQDIAHARSNL